MTPRKFKPDGKRFHLLSELFFIGIDLKDIFSSVAPQCFVAVQRQRS